MEGSTGSFKEHVFSAIDEHSEGVREICNDSVGTSAHWQGRCLTLNGTVFDAEELGLVITSDCGVRVHVSWQHGQAAWHVRHFHPFFLSPFDLNVV